MRRPVQSLMHRRGLVLVFCAALVLSVFPAAAVAHPPAGGDLSVPPTGDPEVTPYLQPGRDPLDEGDDEDEELLKADDAVITRRTAGDVHLSIDQAGHDRAAAHDAGKHLVKSAPISPPTFTGNWTEISPNPIVQITRGSGSAYAVAGRVSALAIRPSNGLKILGGAQGGIWTYDEATGTWIPRADDQSTLSIGSIAIAPSNDSIVYAGTGEGNLSGDSYFGNGFLKSTDGGIHWAPIGGKTSTASRSPRWSSIVNDANHVYAAVIRGRAGSRRQTPIDTSKYGIWESKNGGKTWKNIRKAKDELHGATDLVQDPRSPEHPVRHVLGRRHLPLDRLRQALEAVHDRHPGQRDLRDRRRDAVRDRDLASAPAMTPSCTPASNGPSTASTSRRRSGSRSTAAPLDAPAGRPAGRSGRDRRLLRHAVLLRQRHRGRPEQREHRLCAGPVQLRPSAAGGVFRSDRWRPDLEEPRLGPPPGLPRLRHGPGKYRSA